MEGYTLMHSNIRNGELLKRLVMMGEGDAVVVAGCRFSLPEELPVVDLAVTDDLPTIQDVLSILTTNVKFSEMTIAHEVDETLKSAIEKNVQDLKVNELTYRQLQVVSKNTKFVIRTGDMSKAGVVVLRV